MTAHFGPPAPTKKEWEAIFRHRQWMRERHRAELGRAQVPFHEMVHKITTSGPNGRFEATFTHDEWMDRSREARAAKDAVQQMIHRQAGNRWELKT